MKTEHGIRSKSGYVLGFALAAGIALTATLIGHARPAEANVPFPPVCLRSDGCPPVCTPRLDCGPIDEDTIVGEFIKQKPNLECVYHCLGDQTCTQTNADCSVSTFIDTHSYRRRAPYPAGACPLDAGTAAWVCMTGLDGE
jgi:hypothetical protein